MLQFLRENGLHRTLSTLHEESGVTLNSLPDPTVLTDAVRKGRWDTAIESLSTVALPAGKLFDLYEVLVVELLGRDELDAARAVLRRSAVMQALRQEHGKRHGRLEALLSQRGLTGASVETFFGTTLEARRETVAAQLERELVSVPPGRLLALIGYALRQHVQDDRLSPDTVYDVFHGIVPAGSLSHHEPDDLPAIKPFAHRTLPIGAHVECAAFSPSLLALGLADGFIELVSPATGQRKEVPFQAQEATMMVMQHAVICMEFSSDGRYLAVGTQSGEAALWKVDAGACIKRLPDLHKDGITAVRLSADGQALLTAGYDGSVKLSSTRTGRVTNEMRQHTSFVTDVTFGRDEATIYSCGADGLLCIWDVKQGNVRTITPFSKDRLSHGPLVKLIPVADGLLVCSKAGHVARIHYHSPDVGVVVLADGSTTGVATAVPSPRQRYIYLIHESTQVTCVDATCGAVIAKISASSTDLIGGASHPLYNELVTFDVEGHVKFWRPNS